MSNNILQWNPSKNNQQDDATYTTDPMRAGGAVPGIFGKELANKLFYQLSTLCSALGEMLSNKGYSVSDSNILTLVSTLSNILTKADFGSTSGTVCEGDDSRLYESHSFSSSGHQILASGLILQWVPITVVDSLGGFTASFSVPFTTVVFFACVNMDADNHWGRVVAKKNSFRGTALQLINSNTVINASSGATGTVFAIGY